MGTKMDIKIDRRNYRKHGEKNKELIKKSISELGAGRSILIDNENEIIAGNGVFEQARELNIPIKVIETDGSELIALKRTDLQTDDRKRKQLAIMDNSTNDHSDWDYEALKEDYSQPELTEFGVDILEATESEVDAFFEEKVAKQIKESRTIICCECGKMFKA